LALAKRLTLSRPTTRRAIQELVDKGLLVRKRGVGTQVVQNPVHRRVELTSLFDDLARAGQDPITQLLDYRIGPPDDEVARELNLAADREVVSIRRLRCAVWPRPPGSRGPGDCVGGSWALPCQSSSSGAEKLSRVNSWANWPRAVWDCAISGFMTSWPIDPRTVSGALAAASSRRLIRSAVLQASVRMRILCGS
jgi:hypothetical protein